MPNEFVAGNGLFSLNNSAVTGSLTISGGFTIVTGSGIEFQVSDTGLKNR